MGSLIIIFLVIGMAAALNSIAKNAQQKAKQGPSGTPGESPWDSMFPAPRSIEYAEDEHNPVFSYDEQAISRSEEIKRQQTTALQAKSGDDSSASEQQKGEGRDESSLLDDFDIKKAVIYSEILNPKYKDI